MNIISQNFKDVLKNKIKVIISTNLYKYIYFLMDNFSFTLGSNNNYFNFINLIDTSIKNYILSIISSTFEEFDSQLKNSSERKSRYYINKSNVSRSIITIFGTVHFKRTLFKSKLSNKYVFLQINTLIYLNMTIMTLLLNLLLLPMLFIFHKLRLLVIYLLLLMDYLFL